MPAYQPELPLRFRRRRDLAADLYRLITWLTGRGWKTAAEIAVSLGFSDRHSRLVASSSRGQIISGESGYRLTCEASLEEIVHARNRLLSQARDMERRVSEIDRVRHGRKVP